MNYTGYNLVHVNYRDFELNEAPKSRTIISKICCLVNVHLINKDAASLVKQFNCFDYIYISNFHVLIRVKIEIRILSLRETEGGSKNTRSHK